MIPYNPSSFNTNKTILEQILELKNWLKDHPSYEIFYSSESGNTLAYTGYSLSAISDSTNLDVGDVVIFSNVMVGVVLSVDRDNGTYGCDACVSFKGDAGATGAQGNSFKVTTDNYVNDSTAYSRANVEPVHSVQVGDVILFANDYVGYITSISGVNFYVTRTQSVQGQAGTDGNDGVSITNVSIDGNSHLIVTLSDGNTIDAGSVSSGGIESVSLSIGNGTLSDSDYNKLLTDGAIIIGSNNRIYEKAEEDTLSIIFKCVLFPWTTDNRWGVFTITKSTKEYTHSWQTFTYKSGTATSGQVLQADGSGGASWQNASGGSGLDVLTLTGTSGTLSASDLTKAQGDNCIILLSPNVYFKNRATPTYTYYCTYWISSSGGYIEGNVIRITNSTGAWQTQYGVTIYQNSEGTYIKSTGETSGKVLTTDGNGGATWQTPSGGSGKYLHIIYIKKVSGNINARYFMQYVCDTSTAFSGAFQFATKVYNDGFRTENDAMICNGNEYDGTKVWFPEAFCCEANNVIDIFHNDGNGTTGATQVTTGSVTTFNDKVIAL